jgi:O-acetyl-ADP-ribose deacetylase (regulator of RNase III)
MPVTYQTGNLLDDDAHVLVCPVNAVGVMGKGLALAFKQRWPLYTRPYIKDCRDGALPPGDCKMYLRPNGLAWAALTTKNHWRDPSRYEWIDSGLAELKLAGLCGYTSMAVPMLGCGNGGLDWHKVHPMIHQHLDAFDLRIYGPEVS